MFAAIGKLQMSPSARFFFGMIGLTICLAGGIAMHFFHRTNSPSVPGKSEEKAIPNLQSAESKPEHLKIVSTADEPFPIPDASATDEELLILARSVVAGSSQRAIAWARSQRDSVLARRLLFAVVRAWGESDPDAAVDWVLWQDESERRIDMEAALAGAVKQPQLALSIVRGLLKYYDPDDVAGAGPALVVALGNAGQFQTALEFINGGPPDSRQTG
jgi:hypothetical protein